MKLSELKTGGKASIVKVSGHGGFRKRIVEMGFVKGKVVEALLNAPLNDPIKYKVMGYEVSLRRSEAALIEVVSEEEVTQSMQASPETIVEEEQVRRAALDKRKSITIALVGNPNCGKTTLFNYASGGHEHVGNYSGVTVAAKEGQFDYKGIPHHAGGLAGHVLHIGLFARGTLRAAVSGRTDAGRHHQRGGGFEPGTQPVPHHAAHRHEPAHGGGSQHV